MTVRVTHTQCGQPVDLTDDNRIVAPDTDTPHSCTSTQHDTSNHPAAVDGAA